MLMDAVDIDLARTFLEIVRSGSFIAAGEKLHVTQTAVTARVRNLEGQLGCRLFFRNRSGATLTPDGERFVAHASQLVRTWKAARRELPMPKGVDTLLTLDGETSLWNPLLLQWLSALRSSQETAAVRVEVGGKRKLHDKVDQGVMDAALVHQPDYRPGIQVEQLLEKTGPGTFCALCRALPVCGLGRALLPSARHCPAGAGAQCAVCGSWSVGTGIPAATGWPGLFPQPGGAALSGTGLDGAGAGGTRVQLSGLPDLFA